MLQLLSLSSLLSEASVREGSSQDFSCPACETYISMPEAAGEKRPELLL